MDRFSAIIILMFCSANSFSMDIDGSTISNDLVLTGKIEKNDLARIQSLIKMDGYPETVTISSPGGDVEEAIKIGRFFRKSFITIVATDQCNSACFIIWSGGYSRIAFMASFGLHRPFYDKKYFSKLSVTEAQNKYQKLADITRDYLLDMGIPTSLIDKMMGTKSTDVLNISSEEITKVVDPFASAQKEWLISKCGLLSQDEKKDWTAVTLFTVYRKRIEAGQANKRLKKYGQHASSLSGGYKSYLKEKSREIKFCEEKAIDKVRASIEL